MLQMSMCLKYKIVLHFMMHALSVGLYPHPLPDNPRPALLYQDRLLELEVVLIARALQSM